MIRMLVAALLVAIPLAAGPLSPFFSAPTVIKATATDPSNNIYIAGTVASSAVGNIPTTPGAYLSSEPRCATSSSCARGFVAKISSGGALIFATYIGSGDDGDTVSAIAVDSAGIVFVAGQRIVPPAFPGLDPAPLGFIDKLASDGSKRLASYSITGGFPSAMALSASGDVFATGQTTDQTLKCGCRLVTTSGAFQGTIQGGIDAFAIRLDSTLSHLIYSTFLGGSGNDGAIAIAVDDAGEAYITGSTGSASFPVTPGAFAQPFIGDTSLTREVFVVKFNASGSGLIFSALFDPADFVSTGYAIAVDESGVYVAGVAESVNDPLSPDAFMTEGNQFAAKLAPDGSSLIYQTFVPGTAGLPTPFGITVDASGNLLIMSRVDASPLEGSIPERSVPTTPDSFAPCRDASISVPFILQLNPTGSASLYGSYLPGGLAIRADGEVWYSGSDGAVSSFNIHDPVPTGIRCVADAFSGYSGPIAPGKVVTLIGPGIGPDVPAMQQIDSTVAVGLSGVNVYFNGIAAPLISVSATQIEAVVPFENLDPVEFPTSSVVILKNGVELDGPSVPVAATAPAFMTDTHGCVSAFNSDGTHNSSANPAPLGSMIAVFGDGAGMMSSAVAGGIGNGQSRILAPVLVQLFNSGGLPGMGFPTVATVTTLYAGDVPGFVEGLFQLNLLLPKTFLFSGQQTLTVRIGNSILSPCVWIKR